MLTHQHVWVLCFAATPAVRVMEVLPLADAGARDDPGASRPKSLQQRADESCNFKDPGGAMVISILARNLEHRRVTHPLRLFSGNGRRHLQQRANDH